MMADSIRAVTSSFSMRPLIPCVFSTSRGRLPWKEISEWSANSASKFSGMLLSPWYSGMISVPLKLPLMLSAVKFCEEWLSLIRNVVFASIR